MFFFSQSPNNSSSSSGGVIGGGAVIVGGGMVGLTNHVTSAVVSQSQIQPNFAAAAAAQQNGENTFSINFSSE